MATTVSQPRATSMDKMKYYTVTAPAGREYYAVTTASEIFLSGGSIPKNNLQGLYVGLCVKTGSFRFYL